MIAFKGLILAACLVTALGWNAKRQAIFADGFFCTPICENRTDITGKTAKCLITHDEKVHSTLVRNPGYGHWVFYTVDSIDLEEDKLCEEVIAGDTFLKNGTDTICPSAVQYAKHYVATVGTSNDTEEMKTLIGQLDVAVNKVFQNTGVTTRRFARIDQKANAVARKVIETMNHLKQKVGLIDFEGMDTTSTESPSHDKESEEEPLDGEEEYNNSKEMSKRQDSKDDGKSDDAAKLIKRLVALANNLAKAIENKNAIQSKRTNNSYSSNNDKESDDLKEDDAPTPPPETKYKSKNSSKHKKKGLSFVLPPTSPPYNPNDYSKQGYDHTKRKRKGLSHIAPPTSPPYNPTDYSKEDGDHTTHKKGGFSYNLPPTPPPYNPTGVRHRHILQDYDDENDWPTLPTVNKQREYDTSNCNNKELYYVLPPTSPPYNPNNYRHEHAPEGYSPNPIDDIIRNVRQGLEDLNEMYEATKSESIKQVIEHIYEEVLQMEKIKKLSGTQPESAYPLLLSPIVDAVAESFDSVEKSSQVKDEEDESLRAQYHPIDLDSMSALCGLMTTQICERSKLMHCNKDNTGCCWAYVNASKCDDDFEDCYSALSTILDTLMY